MIRKLLKKLCERMRIQKESVPVSILNQQEQKTDVGKKPPKDYVEGEYEVVESDQKLWSRGKY
jgi:hypothetical protein